MSAAGRVLGLVVDGLFDYAGMFPPASLSFNDALAATLSFPRELKRPALVGSDIVLSFEHLSRVKSEILEEMGFDSKREFRVCVLGSAVQSVEGNGRAEELRSIVQFNRSAEASAIRKVVLSYEIKLAATAQQDHHALIETLRGIQARLQDQPLKIFLEPDLSGPAWQDTLQNICGLIQVINGETEGARVGLKVRASGPTAVTPAKLATVLSAVSSTQLHLKATAGLHHPIVERSRYQNELGFLNLTTALLFKRQLGSAFSERDTIACLTCDQPADYNFLDTLQWKQHRISPQDISRLRESFHFSVGSCSLHEPDQDLLRLFE